MGKEVAADLNVLKFYFVICRLNRFQYSHRAARILFSDSDAIVAALGSCEIGNNFELKANWNIFVKNDCGRRHGVDTVCECLWLWQFHEAISQMVPSWDFHEEEHPSCASHRFFFFAFSATFYLSRCARHPITIIIITLQLLWVMDFCVE